MRTEHHIMVKISSLHFQLILLWNTIILFYTAFCSNKMPWYPYFLKADLSFESYGYYVPWYGVPEPFKVSLNAHHGTSSKIGVVKRKVNQNTRGVSPRNQLLFFRWAIGKFNTLLYYKNWDVWYVCQDFFILWIVDTDIQ